MMYEGVNSVEVIPLDGNGDFASAECVDILKQCDIVCSNPPFSLFRSYLNLIMEHGKQFLIIGNINAVSSKDVFPKIRDGLMWLGVTKPITFRLPDDAEMGNSAFIVGNEKYVKMPICRWFTNMRHGVKPEPLTLHKEYSEQDYPLYDELLAWNVDRTKEIPVDDYFELTIDEEDLEKWQEAYPDLEVLDR